MTDEGFMIDMTVPGVRRAVALAVIRSRLKMATHFKRTDSLALEAARQHAFKEETLVAPKGQFKTMKQALAWVEQEIDAQEKKNAETTR